jgi:hypothetical protein
MPDRSPAERLAASLVFSFDNAVRLAQAYLADAKFGDVPLSVEYRLAMMSASREEADRLLARIDELRAEHFRMLGRPVPERESPDALA